MNSTGVLGLVLTAVYGLTSLLLSFFVALIWRAVFERTALSARALLALRLSPSFGAMALTLFIVLPAFLMKEPKRAAEPVGPVAVLMGAVALVCLSAGFVRACRSWLTTAKLLRDCGTSDSDVLIAGKTVHILDLPGAMFAVVGAWRPRIVAASRALEACSYEELREVIGHEAAHIAAHDNVKFLMLRSCPDPLAWMPVGTVLLKRWRSAVEFEADASATGSDPRKRIALASALIRIARLSDSKGSLETLSMPALVDDVEGRVRRLLAPLPVLPHIRPIKGPTALALFIPLIVIPIYGPVQGFIEALVAFGS